MVRKLFVGIVALKLNVRGQAFGVQTSVLYLKTRSINAPPPPGPYRVKGVNYLQ